MNTPDHNETPEMKIGDLFFIGLPGPEIDPQTRELLETVQPSGVCLFARNIKTPAQTRELTDGIRAICGSKVLISIDQEGGRVDRLRRILEPMPAASQLSHGDDFKELAALTGRALRNLGINMNFAPVVDVGGPDRQSEANGLSTRLLGETADNVISNARAYIDTLSTHNVRSCLKHFPGLAKSSVDSHEELPIVECDEDELETTDLLPYRALQINPERTAVMVAHAAYPLHPLQGRDASGQLIPSSIGGRFIRDLLRNRLGFHGVVVTDDLEMGAIVNTFGIGPACVMALEAGNDQLLICNDPSSILRGYEAVSAAVGDGSLALENVEESRRRTALLAGPGDTFPDFSDAEIGCLADDIRTLKNHLQ